MNSHANEHHVRDEGVSRLYRATRTEEPTPHLDAVIRQAVLRDAAAKPRSGTRMWWPMMALAAAAVLAITVGLNLYLGDAGIGLPQSAMKAPASPPTRVARVEERATASVAVTPPTQSAARSTDSATPIARAAERAEANARPAERNESATRAAERPTGPTTPSEVVARAFQPPKASSEQVKAVPSGGERSGQVLAQAGSRAKGIESTPMGAGGSERVALAPPSAKPARAAESRKDEEARRAVAQERTVEPSADVTTSTVASVPATPPAAAATEIKIADATRAEQPPARASSSVAPPVNLATSPKLGFTPDISRAAAPAETTRAASPEATRAASPEAAQEARSREAGAASSSAAKVGGEPRTVEEWLTLLRRLKREGDQERFAKELEAFKKAHPTAIIPADLKE